MLDGDFSLAAKDTLYRCHDRLLPHKENLFTHLAGKWRDLFNPDYEVLLYDLTSTYFESTPDFPEGDKRRFGYSRDKRSDCVQIVIALVLTTEGYPLAYNGSSPFLPASEWLNPCTSKACSVFWCLICSH